MPPEQQQMPQEQTTGMSSVATAVVAIGLLLGLLMVGIFFYAKGRLAEQNQQGLEKWALVQPSGGLPPAPGSVASKVATVQNLNGAGDFRNAVATYDEIVNNPIATPNAKARATYSVISAEFRDSGDIADYIDNLEEMKKAVLDEKVEPITKVSLMNMIASSYCRSGRTSEIFDRIYSGPLFGDFRVDGDADLSSNKLYEYAYGVYPTSKAGVRIARWYVEDALYKWKTDRAKATQQMEIAERYLSEADRLNAEEVTRFDGIENSVQDVSYWLWRAYDRGILARIKPDPYAGEYKEAYQMFFDRVAQTQHVGSKQQIPFAHVFYARALQKVDKNVEAAKAELVKAAQYAQNDPNPKASEFIIFIKNEYPRTSPISQMLHELADLSPEFKSFVESVTS